MTAPQTPAKASLIEDFVDVFTSPSQLFARRAGQGAWLVLFIIVVVAAGLYFATKGLMPPGFAAEWARIVARVAAKDPQAASQMEAGRAIAEKFNAVAIIIFVGVGPILTGLVVWLVGKIFGSVASAGDAIMIAIYACIPRLLAFVAAAVIMLVIDPASVTSKFTPSLSLGRFMDPNTTSPMLFELAGRVDVFVIWQTILIAIGLSVVGKIQRSQAYIAAAIIWLIGAAFPLLGAMRQ
jgi:hypothetical protein